MDTPANNEEAKCFECGQSLSGGTLGGMCPRCLASYATEGDEDTFPPGTMIRYFGDFELEEEIGRGGVGVVYRARQVSLDRLVAVKMLLSAELANRETVQRFRLEARAAAKLDHEGIVPIYETGEHEMQNYYVMKFVDGGRSILNLPKKEDSLVVAKAVLRVAQAIEYAHSMGVLHRDLKPSNILLNDDDEPMLTDFGLAKLLENDAGLTRPSSMMGTPQYLSPEVAKEGFKSVTKKVDVYGIGVVLYELLTGRPPFSGGNPSEIVERVLSDEVIFSTEQDEDLRLICLKCLAKNPEERYESAQAVAEELGRYINGEPLLIRPRGRLKTLQLWVRTHPIKFALVLLSSLVLFLTTHGVDRYLDSLHRWQDNLGVSLDTDGNLLAIGDVNSPSSANHRGSVTVIDPESQDEVKVCYPSGEQRNPRFGEWMAIDGRWLVVGVPSDSRDLFGAGAVTVYDLEAEDGTVRKLRSPKPGWGYAFGAWVDIEGNVVAIHENQAGKDGEVYLFDIESGELLSRLVPDGVEDRVLGKGVKLSGKNLVFPTSSKSQPNESAKITVYDISNPKSPVEKYSVKMSDFGLTSKVALRLVAVKMLLSAELANRETVQRFRLEARAAAKLDHEGIVPIYETGEHEMQNYYVMKFVDGGRSILNLPKKEDSLVVAKAVLRVAQAIEYAHSMGVLHRDLKPSNILLNDDDEPMLTDFGLAKLLENDAGLTRPSSMMGTPQYLSPEVAKEGFKSVTKKVDVYGIGVVLYELLTGRPPFSGGNPSEIVERVLSDEVIFSTEQDEDLRLICLKCLAKNPEERYESAQAVAEELGRYINGEPLLIRPRGRLKTLQLWVRTHPIKFALVLLSSLVLFLTTHGVDRYLDSLHRWQDNLGVSLDTDGNLLAIGDVNSPSSANHRGSVTVIDPESQDEVKVCYPSGEQRNPRFGEWMAIDGRWLVVGVPSDSRDLFGAGAVTVYDLEAEDGTVRKLRSPKPGWGYAFGAWVDIEGNVVAIHENQAGKDGEVYLFDIESGELLSRLVPDGVEDRVLGKGVKLSGKNLVFPTSSKSQPNESAKITVYDISNPKSPVEKYSVKMSDFGLTSKVALRLVVSETHMAVSSQEGSVYLLDLETGKLRSRIPSAGMVKNGELALSSELLAVRQPLSDGGGHRISLYDVENGKSVHTISSPDTSDAKSFGRSLAIANEFLYVGVKSSIPRKNGRNPVYRFRLSDGELDGELVASRRSPLRKRVVQFLAIFSLVVPPLLMVCLVVRKKRSR